MNSILIVGLLASTLLAAPIAGVIFFEPVSAQAVANVNDQRQEVIAKLDAKIASLEAELAALEAEAAQPGLTPSESARLRAEINKVKAQIRVCRVDRARVARLPARALEALNARLPDIVSPT